MSRMTRYEKTRFKVSIQRMTDDELRERFGMLSDRMLGSVSDVMMALAYPPDMIQEQYDNERDTEWCYNYVGTQMKERGLLDEEPYIS